MTSGSSAERTATEVFRCRIEAYLQSALSDSTLRLVAASRIVGGASRETWSVAFVSGKGTEDQTGVKVIVRMDPDASLLPSNRRAEYEVYRAFGAVPGVPVPHALFIEDDPSVVGKPFFVMSKVEGASWPGELLSSELDEYRPQIAAELVSILGRIASTDYSAIGLDSVLSVPALNDVWGAELDRWQQVLSENDLGPNPATEAVIRHLRRDPPPVPSRLSVVHGDYRIGNFLFTKGGIAAILDWEMAHLGDPHEDLAWLLARNWRPSARPDLVCGLMPRDRVIGLWQDASGMSVDRDALQWYELFTHVKANAIWITGANQFVKGRSDELMYAFIHWTYVDKQEQWMLEDLMATR